MFLIVSELMAPVVTGQTLTGVAGQSFSVECVFTMTPHLITSPTVQWLDSTDSVVSDNGTLSLNPLMTSDGGVYTCRVDINISQLNVFLTGEGDTILAVESE